MTVDKIYRKWYKDGNGGIYCFTEHSSCFWFSFFHKWLVTLRPLHRHSFLKAIMLLRIVFPRLLGDKSSMGYSILTSDVWKFFWFSCLDISIEVWLTQNCSCYITITSASSWWYKGAGRNSGRRPLPGDDCQEQTRR
jgi:hypothetical protein